MANAVGGELSLLFLAENDPAFGLALQPDDHLVESLILGAEFGHEIGFGFVGEPLLDLAGVLVHGCTTAAGLLGLSGDEPAPAPTGKRPRRCSRIQARRR